MGCGDACPIFPGKRYLDWDLTDPAGKTIEELRPIRDDTDARVRALLAELVPATAWPNPGLRPQLTPPAGGQGQGTMRAAPAEREHPRAGLHRRD